MTAGTAVGGVVGSITVRWGGQTQRGRVHVQITLMMLKAGQVRTTQATPKKERWSERVASVAAAVAAAGLRGDDLTLTLVLDLFSLPALVALKSH